MEANAANAAYDDLHSVDAYHDGTFRSWSKKRDDGHPYFYSSGVTIDVADRDLNPDDLFTTEVDASPLGSVSEKTPGEQDEAAEEGDEGD